MTRNRILTRIGIILLASGSILTPLPSWATQALRFLSGCRKTSAGIRFRIVDLADVDILAREFSQEGTPINVVSPLWVDGKIKSQAYPDINPRNPLQDIPPALFLPPAHILLGRLKVVGVLQAALATLLALELVVVPEVVIFYHVSAPPPRR